jgi:hypothetical protein
MFVIQSKTYIQSTYEITRTPFVSKIIDILGLLAKCPCVAMALEKNIFMTLENNMLALTHFLRALSHHI